MLFRVRHGAIVREAFLLVKKKPIEQYAHRGKQRANNPPVGSVTLATDRESGKKTYDYDPHLDPQLVWAGKAERGGAQVPARFHHPAQEGKLLGIRNQRPGQRPRQNQTRVFRPMGQSRERARRVWIVELGGGEASWRGARNHCWKRSQNVIG